VNVAEEADGTDESGFRHARDALVDVVFTREFDAWRAWQAAEAPKAWADASITTRSFSWLTAEELSEFKRDFDEFLEQSVLAQLDRADPAQRPAGARPVRLVAWAFPVLAPDENEADG
jgi:hypothetical protein